MPVTFSDSTIKRREGEWAALPEELELSPDLNGRHDLPDIEWLIESLLMPHGQIQPVSIRKSAGKPVLTSGYSRYRAVVEINKRGLTPEPLKLRCSYTQLTDQQAFVATIHENMVRNQTTPMDDAYNIQKLVNVFHQTEAEIADVYRASVQWVRDRLTLLELAPEAETAVRQGRMKPPAAKALTKLSKEAQKRVVAKQGTITAADVKRETPAASKKPEKPSLKSALAALMGECDQQPDVMVYEIDRDTIRNIRAAMEAA